VSCVCKTIKDTERGMGATSNSFFRHRSEQEMQTLGKSCKYKASTVQLYSSKMMPTSQKLKDVGKEIDNEKLTVLLLQGLTRQYSPYQKIQTLT